MTANTLGSVFQITLKSAIAFDSLLKKVKRLIEKGNYLRKYPKAKRLSGTYKEALSSFGSLFEKATVKSLWNFC